MKKKTEAYFTWLNNNIFWKNYAKQKTSYDHKRITLCKSHKKAR